MTLELEPGDPWPFASSRGLTGAPMAPKWFALITAPQREKRASDRLRNAGVEVRYPTVERTRHIRGQKRKFIHPMISQIIYARFRYAPQWDVMKERRLITGVFARDGQPIELSQDDIARVMGLPTEAERLEAARIEAMRPRVGEKAEILDGPLAGLMVDVTRVEFGRVWWAMVTGIKGDAPEKSIRRA